MEIPKTRNIPVWLAVLLILACAGGGGYLAYKFLLGGRNDKIVVLERSPDQHIQQARRARNLWIVPGDTAMLMVSMSNPQQPTLQFSISRRDLTHDQNVLVYLGTRGDLDDQLDLTAAQLRKIRALGRLGHVEPPPAQMDAMRDVFLQWFKAPEGQVKIDLESKLFNMLDDDTKAIDAQSKAAQIDKADKVRAILTPEQLKKLPNVRLPWAG